MQATLHTPLSEVTGIAPGHVKKIAELGIRRVEDLLRALPRRYDDLSRKPINTMRAGESVVLIGALRGLKIRRLGGRRTMVNGMLEDTTGRISVSWFNQDWLLQMVKDGQEVEVAGTVKRGYGGRLVLQPKGRPKVVAPTDPTIFPANVQELVPVYPLTAGVSNDWFRDKIHRFLPLLETVEDPMPDTIRMAHGLLSLPDALREIHVPSSAEKLAAAKRRLGFDELFTIQLSSLQQKMFWKNDAAGAAIPFPLPTEAIQAFVAGLPFQLTKAQRVAAFEILKDLEKPVPMLRLLEGDVGSGKTLVAAIAIRAVIVHRAQAALLAPTEILARQHGATLTKLLAPLGVNVQLLVGSTPGGQRKELLMGLAQGTVDLVVGTHAILEPDVIFHKLGLAVVDEQHRFGVKQRAALRQHGTPHLLTMTATPIPRTMALTIYGDQDLSVLDEMPPGRQVIRTKVVTNAERAKAVAFIADEMRAGRQVFVICPLIDESTALEVKSVTAEYDRLREHVFQGFRVGLLHGRMKPSEKDNVMGAFARNEIDLLVSTSVVEVGIDIPNASVMLIEGAERFGLAQLHQFRGRVGRGEHQSYCLLFASGGTDPDGITRLRAMEQEASGFKLAELDLRLRGPGEVFGTRQSGIPDLRMASLLDRDLILETRTAAESVLAEDPSLAKHPHLLAEVQRNLAARSGD